VNSNLDSLIGGNRKTFHVLIGMGVRGSQSAITIVRKTPVKKEMTPGSPATTAGRDVDVGKLFRENRYDTFYGNPEKNIPEQDNRIIPFRT